jgi:hypothetical protein
MSEQDHLSDALIQVVLDDTSPPEDSVQVHLDECRTCATAVQERRAAAEAVSRALKILDVPPNVDEAFAAVQRARRVQRWTSPAHLARAAILVVAFSGVLSAAVPGSPVRVWLGSAWKEVAGLFPRTPDAASPVPVAGEAAIEDLEDEAGLRVDAREMVRIRLVNLQPGSVVTVDLVQDVRAGVFASGALLLRSGPGFLEVTDPPGNVRVELPQRGRRGTVVVNGRTYLRKAGDSLEISGPVLERTETRIRFRVPD